MHLSPSAYFLHFDFAELMSTPARPVDCSQTISVKSTLFVLLALTLSTTEARYSEQESPSASQNLVLVVSTNGVNCLPLDHGVAAEIFGNFFRIRISWTLNPI